MVFVEVSLIPARKLQVYVSRIGVYYMLKFGFPVQTSYLCSPFRHKQPKWNENRPQVD